MQRLQMQSTLVSFALRSIIGYRVIATDHTQMYVSVNKQLTLVLSLLSARVSPTAAGAVQQTRACAHELAKGCASGRLAENATRREGYASMATTANSTRWISRTDAEGEAVRGTPASSQQKEQAHVRVSQRGCCANAVPACKGPVGMQTDGPHPPCTGCMHLAPAVRASAFAFRRRLRSGSWNPKRWSGFR